MNIHKLVRKCVRGFQPYIPGRSIESIQRELHLKKIIKLASNENPLGPSRKAVDAIRKSAESIFLYPDGFCLPLRQALARKCRVSRSEVFLGSGSDEIIEIIAKTFFSAGDNIVVSRHAFLRYKMAGALMGIRVNEVPMRAYTHDLDAMAKAADRRTKAVFIANPNNPTGTFVSAQALRVFLRSIKRDVLVILDEAYFEYASAEREYPDGVDLFKKGFRNVITLRTFSKIYGLAGLRVGYGIGSSGVIEAMDRVRPPFNITRLSMDAALASLADTAIVKKSQNMVSRGKESLYRALKKLNLAYIPSAGNFVLIRVPGGGNSIFRKLLYAGVIVRAMDEYDLPEWVRVTIGTPEEMKYFIKALKDVMRRIAIRR